MDPVVSALGPKSTNLLIQSRRLSYRHLSTTESSSVLKIHLSSNSLDFYYIDICLLQFPWSQRYQTSYNRLCLYNTDTSLLRTVLLVLKIPIFIQSRRLWYWHLSTTDCSLGPRGTKLHTVSSTSLIQIPLYYGQFPWSQKYQSFNTVSTSVIQNVFVPKIPIFIQTLPTP